MLKGKVAIVTGASRGIGAAIAKKLASLGADIAVIYAGNKDAANEVCRICREEYAVRAEAFSCDVGDYEAAKETVNAVKTAFGSVHILVNNAGITRDGLSAMMSEKQFEDVIDTNLKGTFHMIRHCSGIFMRNRSGVIVNVSSVSGMVGNAGQCNYSASKAGIIGLTKSVAKELAARGVRCNAVAPGFIETDMTKTISDENNALMSAIPLARKGRPEEVADAVAFLIQAEYITGEILRVDGGLAM